MPPQNQQNQQTKLEKYEEIQALVQKEIQTQFPHLYDQYATKFGVAQVPLHTHNGVDANKISQSNVIPSLRASGSIKFATDATRYTVQLTGSPTSVTFYGNAVRKTAGVIDIRAHIVGSAQLGPSYFFQPLNTTTVSPSGIIGNVIQSSSFFLVSSTGAAPLCLTAASEGHLAQVQYPGGTIVAQMTIPNIWTKATFSSYTDKGWGNGFIYVDVDLDNSVAGVTWEINGNFVVT